MATLAQTFKIHSGGTGIKEVERFIAKVLGRDLRLIHSISAVSINATTTELTLNYHDRPKKSVQVTNPPNGFVCSTGSPIDTVFIQYADAINEFSIQTSFIQITGRSTSDWYVESGTNNHVLGVQLNPTADDVEDTYTVLLDDEILNYRGQKQEGSTVLGFSTSTRAIVTEGDEEVYSAGDLRGSVRLKYARIDASSNPTRKLKEMLVNTDELISFASVQKDEITTELFLLVVDEAEPRVVSTFPRQGANNPDDQPFSILVLSFADAIDITQATIVDGTFSIFKAYGDTALISAEHVTALDDRTVQFDTEAIRTQHSISSAYINIFVREGLRSAKGIPLTKGYLYGHMTSKLTFDGGGGTGPTGPPGADGEPGPSGASGQGFAHKGAYDPAEAYVEYDVVIDGGGAYVSIQDAGAGVDPSQGAYWDLWSQSGEGGDQGVQGDQGIQGVQGVQGDQGVQGIQGVQGVQGDAGDPGADGADGVSFIWSGIYLTSDAYEINDVVEDNGSTYICIQDAAVSVDPSQGDYWDIMSQSGDTGADGAPGGGGSTNWMYWVGEWAFATDYRSGDGVSWSGESFVCVEGFNSTTPPTDGDPIYWYNLGLSTGYLDIAIAELAQADHGYHSGEVSTAYLVSGAGAAIAIDWTQSNYQSITLPGSATVSFTPPAGAAGLTLLINYTIEAGTITWPAAAYWSADTEPSWSWDQTLQDIVTFVHTEGTAYYGAAAIGFSGGI